MAGSEMKPWSLTPIWNLVLPLFVLFLSGTAVLVVRGVVASAAASVTKLLIVVLATSLVVFGVSTLMWTRHWRNVW